MTARNVGRRVGAPAATSTAAPENQPTASARIESNDTGESTNPVTVNPAIRAHPARRHRRPSQGAAAVSTPTTAAMPAVEGKPWFVSGLRSTPTSTSTRPGSVSIRASSTVTSAAATSPAAATVASIRHRRPRSVHQRTPPRTTHSQDPCPDDDNIDDPGRHGVDPSQEV